MVAKTGRSGDSIATVGRSSGGIEPTDMDGKYYIYSSTSKQNPSINVQVLKEGTNIDKFVSFLESKVIILNTEPKPTGTLDSSDELSKWLTQLDPKGTFSLTLNTPDIKSFEFKLTAPWPIVFSSSAADLNFSFGAPTQNAGQSAARIPAPGINNQGTWLCCGLDPQKTENLNSSVKEIFDYVGADARLPALVSGLKITLETKSASEKRNAMWLDASYGLQTTIRLQFQVDNASELQKIVNSALTNFEIQSADVICKKVAIAVGSGGEPKVVNRGRIVFSVKCFVTTKSQDKVNTISAIEFKKSTISLIFQFPSTGSFTHILSWLGEQISADLGFVDKLLAKGNIFENTNLRQISVNLDTRGSLDKPVLSYFSIEIEVTAKFDKDNNATPVPFLIRYVWSNEGDNLGYLEGQLWNSLDESGDPDLEPYYEEWINLQPLTQNAGTSIDLATIIPGEQIYNIPDNIPTKISRVSIFLSETTFSLGGTIQTVRKQESSFPQLYLDRVRLDASYTWGKESAFKVSLGVQVELEPSPSSKNQDTATLTGQLDYTSSSKTWELKANLVGLYASILYSFFDGSSADHVMPLIDSIEISSLSLDYKYEGRTGANNSRSVGSSFKINGLLLVAGLQLELDFDYKGDWTFKALLKSQGEHAKVGDIVASILGDHNLDLPDFLRDAKLNGGLEIHVNKSSTSMKGGSFLFIAEIKIGSLVLTFAQYHGSKWEPKTPSKRMVKVALTALPSIKVPLVGDLTQPFDEMYYIWIQDTTKINLKLPGFTRQEIGELNDSLSDKLVFTDNLKEKKDSDVLICAGSHFAVIMKSSSSERICILDYDFMKPKERPSSSARLSVSHGSFVESGEAQEDDSSSAQAPLKKKAGPLSISNIGLKYSGKMLHIIFDATFELGPLEFSLIGFSIDLTITSLDSIPQVCASIQGLSLAYEKAPLTIAGSIRHGLTAGLDYYSGGLIVGFSPYQLQAAGFYGLATLPDGQEFTSVFIFARLDGPLIEFEFGEISGVTGGFGYKSEVRMPSASQVLDFPFIANHLSGETENALKTLEKLTTPGTSDSDGWFKPMDDMYWAAAGLKVDAFQMLSISAVVVVQFGASIKLNISAVALADIPDAKASVKFAHVELGISIVVDLDYGILKAEAQLSPNSYILDPNCHLTGGYGFYYWFDAPHADQSQVGHFVFTMGGYHQAFAVPEGYPHPPRVGISWRISNDLSIVGQSYFAITPKACMGGGRIHAAYSTGPITAWFDAFADFLINYKPFYFELRARISVGVRLDLDVWFISIHESTEICAELSLWGPSIAGRVHVDFWFHSFNIDFGDSSLGNSKGIELLPFYELVLQASSQQGALPVTTDTKMITNVMEGDNSSLNQGHIFLAQSGLMNTSEDPHTKQNSAWTVRGGIFSFIVSCKMAIGSATGGKTTITFAKDNIYAKPMHLVSPMSSSLKIDITQKGVLPNDAEWGMEKIIKSVPKGLWGKYSRETDPSGGNNNVGELLNSKDGGVSLMMGVVLTAPPPIMAPDKLPAFNIEDAELEELRAKKNFPARKDSHVEWNPQSPLKDGKQWKAVHDTWTQPGWGTGNEGQTGFVESWAKTFGWDEAIKKLAAIPKNLGVNFDNLYVAAPLISTG